MVCILLTLWGFAAGVGAMVLCCKPADMAALGQWGDMFGILNSLFSALAFGGTLFAIHLQNTQIEENAQQIRDQKTHQEELMRRQKLEEFAAALAEVIDEITGVEIEVDKGQRNTHADRLAMCVRIVTPIRKASLLAALYFPSIRTAFTDGPDLNRLTVRILNDEAEAGTVKEGNIVGGDFSPFRDAYQTAYIQAVTKKESLIRTPDPSKESAAADGQQEAAARGEVTPLQSPPPQPSSDQPQSTRQ